MFDITKIKKLTIHPSREQRVYKFSDIDIDNKNHFLHNTFPIWLTYTLIWFIKRKDFGYISECKKNIQIQVQCHIPVKVNNALYCSVNCKKNTLSANISSIHISLKKIYNLFTSHNTFCVWYGTLIFYWYGNKNLQPDYKIIHCMYKLSGENQNWIFSSWEFWSYLYCSCFVLFWFCSSSLDTGLSR